jgi:hypothetical protein
MSLAAVTNDCGIATRLRLIGDGRLLVEFAFGVSFAVIYGKTLSLTATEPQDERAFEN